MPPIPGTPPDSWVHRLHPLVKLTVASGFTLTALMLSQPLSLALMLLFFLGLILLSGYVPTGRGLLSAGLFLGLVTLGNYWVSADAAEAAKYSLRLAVVLVGVPVCAATTPPQELARALARLRLPPALVVSLLLVWRFFPVLKEEVREIREANLLRGRGGDGLRDWHRGLLVPLAFIILDYAERVSLALELRGFDPAAPRTWYRTPRLGWRDGVFALGAGAVLLVALMGERHPWRW